MIQGFLWYAPQEPQGAESWKRLIVFSPHVDLCTSGPSYTLREREEVMSLVLNFYYGMSRARIPHVSLTEPFGAPIMPNTVALRMRF